jgi:hypothetical protein
VQEEKCLGGVKSVFLNPEIASASPVQKTVDKEEVDKVQKEARLKKELSDCVICIHHSSLASLAI